MLTGDATAPDPTTYVYKSSLMGAASEFKLLDHAIEWRRGNRAVLVAYRDVRKVRLAFRPMSTQMHRFLIEIWSRDGGKLSLASCSWRSMVEQERLDAAYTAFVTELHRRIAAAGAPATFLCGSPALLYWPGVVIFAGLCLSAAYLASQAVQTDAWVGVAVVGVLLLVFLWQMGMFFHRNRPGRYSPDRLPPLVMP